MWKGFLAGAEKVVGVFSQCVTDASSLKDLCAIAGVKWMSQPQARVAKEREAEFGVGADAVQAMLCNIGNLVDRIAA